MNDHKQILGYGYKMLTLTIQGYYGSKLDEPPLNVAVTLRGGSMAETQEKS